MRRFGLSLVVGILPIMLAAAPPAKLPPANPVPFSPDPEEAAVMVPINALLRALETSDQKAILAVVRPEGGVTVALERPDGVRAVRHLGWAQFAAMFTPGPDRFTEKLATPAIEIDGDMAMVWASYTSLTNDKMDHCGTDLFDLVREGGSWKIMNVTWSQRTTGCQ